MGNYSIGVLIGASRGSVVSNSYTTGAVRGNFSVGGLIGDSFGSVSNSYAMGTMTGAKWVGGLIGDSFGSVSNSYAMGTMTGAKWVGGLIGYSHGSASNSYATGAVTGGVGGSVGGLIGQLTGGSSVVSNSHATGTVTAANWVGGLIGGVSEGGSYSVNNSYATGTVMGGRGGFVGGLIGRSYGSVTEKNYFVDASGGSDGIGSGTCSGTCERKTAADIAALTSSTTGWAISTSGTTGNWNFGTATQFPAVLYSGGGCETISGTNAINSNEGDANIPDCGDIIKGQKR